MQSKINKKSVPLRGAWTRRTFCSALGVGGLTWALPAYPLSSSLPWPSCIGSGPALHQRIDAHVHIFNGTDLQIAGFLKISVANEYPILEPVLRLIADPLQRYVWENSPKAQDELNRLNQIASRSGARSFAEQGFGPALQEDRAKTKAQYNEFLRQQFSNEEVRRRLIEMIGQSTNKRSDFHITIEVLRKAPPKTGTDARELARRIDKSSGIPLFDALEPFFSYRYSNFLELVQQFTCEKMSSIDTFVTLLVDFDQTLGEPPGASTPSTIDHQAEVTSRICQLSRGHLLALAPYCPLKDAASPNTSLTNVLEAWTRPGFVGAKLYPPMGFYPYGNDGKVKNGQAIDRALAGFYSECIRKDAVVVAHAGPSYCATPGNCEYPGPDGWRCALKFVLDNENKPLRAALAHFGGPFDDKPEASIWPEAFLDLMKEGYGQKLYADLSYANEVLDPLKQTHVVNRLIDLGKHSPLLYERLTYGSDWLLLGLEMQWRSYAKRMEVVIDKTEKRSGATGFKARFFGGNAHDWLGLNEPISLGSKNTDGL